MLVKFKMPIKRIPTYFLLFAFFASMASAGDLFQNVRLVWTTNPQSEAMIIWESDEPSAEDYVEVTAPDGEVVRFSATKSVAYTNKSIPKKKKKRKKKNKGVKVEIPEEAPEKVLEKAPDWFYRHVSITGLEPSTSYQVSAFSDGEKSRIFTFITAPDDKRPFKLIYVGDSRTDVEVAVKISKQLAQMASEDPEILAVLHGGDYANNPVLEDWKPWLAAWDQTTGKDGKLLPIIPVVGNHERMNSSPLYGEAYGFPGKNEEFLYSCKLSPHFRIAVLNSEIPATGVQTDFLKDTLERYKQEQVQWQIAAFHRPVYPAVKKAGALVRLIPMFEEYSIDLVLESDGHCIKRTVPIKADKLDPNGVVYLGEGGFGAPQRTPKEKWYLESPGFASKSAHSMILYVKEDMIDYYTINSDGDILDRCEFLPKER